MHEWKILVLPNMKTTSSSYYPVNLLFSCFVFFPSFLGSTYQRKHVILVFLSKQRYSSISKPVRLSWDYSHNFEVCFKTHLTMWRMLGYSCCQDLRLENPASVDFKQCFEYNLLHNVVCWFFKFLEWTIGFICNFTFLQRCFSGIIEWCEWKPWTVTCWSRLLQPVMLFSFVFVLVEVKIF